MLINNMFLSAFICFHLWIKDVLSFAFFSSLVGWTLPTGHRKNVTQNGGQCPPYKTVHICTRLGMSETDAFPRGSVGTRTLTTVIGELCLTIKRFYLRSSAFICGLKMFCHSQFFLVKTNGKKTTRINLRYSRG